MSGWFGGKTDAKADEAAKTGPSVQDRAIEAKDQTISFIGEKSEAVTKAASDTADAAVKMGGDAMGKASETGQAITDRAMEFTKEPAAPKEPTGNMFQRAGGQVMGAATGAKDAVKNTLGMGGDKGDAGSAK